MVVLYLPGDRLTSAGYARPAGIRNLCSDKAFEDLRFARRSGFRVGLGLFGARSFGSLGAAIFGSLGAPIFGSLGAAIFGSLGAAIFGSLGAAIFGSLGAPIFGSLGAPIFGSLGAPIFGSLGAATVRHAHVDVSLSVDRDHGLSPGRADHAFVGMRAGHPDDLRLALFRAFMSVLRAP